VECDCPWEMHLGTASANLRTSKADLFRNLRMAFFLREAACNSPTVLPQASLKARASSKVMVNPYTIHPSSRALSLASLRARYWTPQSGF
jgi:hypothetical protein